MASGENAVLASFCSLEEVKRHEQTVQNFKDASSPRPATRPQVRTALDRTKRSHEELPPPVGGVDADLIRQPGGAGPARTAGDAETRHQGAAQTLRRTDHAAPEEENPACPKRKSSNAPAEKLAAVGRPRPR